ncbi:hypothetical protein EDD22DRAFT_566879 [Suillus occidentalis]|nr:hypothetical protein EDD22DRAFT_566879 [Suillus occidentalis]
MPPSSRTPVELLRIRTEAHPSGSDLFARRLLRNNLPLPQRADDITRARGEWGGHCEPDSEVILVDPDWIMRSPSPVELYAPACVAHGSIYSTIEPTYDVQQYEDTDIVMASPSHHTRSPSPEQTQDSTSLESCLGEEPHRSTTPTPDSKPWGYSPWAETDATKFELTEDSWGSDASKFESTEDSWGGDATKDEPSEESSRGTKPRSSTPGALEDAWDSFSW